MSTVALNSKEHADLMNDFEKVCKQFFYTSGRFDREKDPELRKKGWLYEDGAVNELFRMYRFGYVHGKGMGETN